MGLAKALPLAVDARGLLGLKTGAFTLKVCPPMAGAVYPSATASTVAGCYLTKLGTNVAELRLKLGVDSDTLALVLLSVIC